MFISAGCISSLLRQAGKQMRPTISDLNTSLRPQRFFQQRFKALAFLVVFTIKDRARTLMEALCAVPPASTNNDEVPVCGYALCRNRCVDIFAHARRKQARTSFRAWTLFVQTHTVPSWALGCPFLRHMTSERRRTGRQDLQRCCRWKERLLISEYSLFLLEDHHASTHDGD